MNVLPTICFPIRMVAVAIAILWAQVTIADGPVLTDGNVQRSATDIVQRALPAVVDGAFEWMNDKDCLSCHRVSFSTWAINRSLQADFSLDTASVRTINGWTADWQKIANPRRRAESNEQETLVGDPDTVAQILLGRVQRPTGQPAEPWVATYRQALLAAQQPAGFWKAGGQLPLQKRPKRETNEVTTAWSLIALADSSDGAADESVRASFDKAKQWLATAKDGKSTEWWATQAILQSLDKFADSTDEAGAEQSVVENSEAKLLQLQNEDGGWGWLISDPSDALATGIALYALAKTGHSANDEAIERAIIFLADTQEEDGSWSVNGTKSNSSDHVTDTASYWGICWVVIGLLEVMAE